ncbi:hypothetical protein F4818DRAFT_113073 [Hypoxylon cercidicola]|nr:hypothetical protein F4818DRAFT_113073 [Hypoxylon cercidicola]
MLPYLLNPSASDVSPGHPFFYSSFNGIIKEGGRNTHTTRLGELGKPGHPAKRRRSILYIPGTYIHGMQNASPPSVFPTRATLPALSPPSRYLSLEKRGGEYSIRPCSQVQDPGYGEASRLAEWRNFSLLVSPPRVPYMRPNQSRKRAWRFGENLGYGCAPMRRWRTSLLDSLLRIIEDAMGVRSRSETMVYATLCLDDQHGAIACDS